MSGVTCQFCGKPLWRIRRGSDGDFCSREHRNQYKLRMGLSQLAEAEKASTILRRTEVCNTLSLGRAAGPPEPQVRQSCPCALRHVSTLRLPGARLPGPAGLPDARAAAMTSAREPAPAQPARLPLAFPRREVCAGLARPALFGLARSVRANILVRPPRVPAADGALRRPVFLIARFPHRLPAMRGQELTPRPAPSKRTAAPLPCLPRARSEGASRVAAQAFHPAAPPLPAIGKPNDLADLPCVPYPLMPYRSQVRPVAADGSGNVSVLPIAAGPVLVRKAKGAVEIPAAGTRASYCRVEGEVRDALPERKSLCLGPAAARPPVVPEIGSGAQPGASAERGFHSPVCESPKDAGATPRSASTSRGKRRVVCGKRAVWNGRVRLPGGRPRRLNCSPAAVPVLSRTAAVDVSTGRTSVPPLSLGAPAMPVEGAVALAAASRGVPRVRVRELPPPGRDLMIAPMRPAIRGGLTDPMPGEAVRVFEDHFGDGLESWSGDTAGWKIDIAGVRPGGRAWFVPSLGLADYRLEFLARVERGHLDCLFRSGGEDSQVIRIGSGGSVERFAMLGGSVQSRHAASAGGSSAKSLTFQLDVQGETFSLAVNGKEIDRWSDSRLPTGGAGFASGPQDRSRLYWVKLTCRMPEN